MKTKLKKVLYFLVIFILLLFFLIILIYLIKPLPKSINSLKFEVYDTNNSLIFESNNEKTSHYVSLEEIPTSIKQSFITIEDKRFYRHFGIDFIRTFKSLLQNIKEGDIVAGGSTITQQLARNLYLNQEKTIKRKINELFYAIQLELKYSKDKILEEYLNSVYFGHGIYGIKDASDYFFSKSLDELDYSEIATLLGSCNSPTFYSPFLYPENALSKRNDILYLLYKSSILSLEEYENEIKKKLPTYQEKVETHSFQLFYIDAVIEELNDLNLLNNENGLKVYTYYDFNVQKKLEESTKEVMAKEDNMQMAGIIIEPYTFHILAIKGSVDYSSSQFNRALYGSRQIASTIKPLLYYLAIEEGFDPLTTFLSSPTSFQISKDEIYTPSNYNDYYPNKEVSLAYAISASDNIYAIKTHLFLGMDTLYNSLQRLGITNATKIPSLAIGCISLTPMELSKIYAIFASEGLYKEPTTLHLVENQEGEVLYTDEDEPIQLLNQDSVLMISQLLRAPFDITSPYPTLLGFEPITFVGAKSGTSDWDSWICGYNPKYSITIWNGYDKDKTMTTYDERSISRLIFKKTFDALLPSPSSWYTPTDNLMSIPISLKDNCYDSNGSIYWFKK